MRKQCPFCLNPVPGHAHFCPRCGRVITRRALAASLRLARRAGAGAMSRFRARALLLLTLAIFATGVLITVAGWRTWQPGGAAPLPAVVAGVLTAALGLSAAAALAVNAMTLGGTGRTVGHPAAKDAGDPRRSRKQTF